MNPTARTSVFLAALFFSALALYPLPAPALELAAGPCLECGPAAQFNDLHQYDGDPLDLQGCQQNCRSIYGVDLYGFGGGGGDGRNVGYAVCIQKCNARYWKAWDKEMKDLGKDD